MYSHRCSRLVAWKLLAGGLLELPKEVKVGGLELVSVQPGHSLQGRLHYGHEENEVRKVTKRGCYLWCGAPVPVQEPQLLNLGSVRG